MAEKTKKIIKMTDLAKLANVSVSTVSRALSGSPLSNEKTRARILELAEKHHYHVNENARNFRLQKNHMISVVLVLDVKSGQHISDLFYLEMLGAIADSLSSKGYDMVVVHGSPNSFSELSNSRAFRQCDGIIFIGQGLYNKTLNELATTGKPMAVWGAHLPDRKYCLIGSDNELGGYLATKHLLNLGRKRVAFLGDVSMPEAKKRFEGYCRAMQEKHVELDKELQIDVPFGMDRASEAIGELLHRRITFDGAFCCSDLIAISVIGALRENCVEVPEDVAVVGYDDIVLASHSSPSLTSVRQNIYQGGRLLVQKVLAQINGDRVGDSILRTELIVRRSSGAW